MARYQVYGIVIDVVKPDGTEAQFLADRMEGALVDSLEIIFDGNYADDDSWAMVNIRKTK